MYSAVLINERVHKIVQMGNCKVMGILKTLKIKV